MKRGEGSMTQGYCFSHYVPLHSGDCLGCSTAVTLNDNHHTIVQSSSVCSLWEWWPKGTNKCRYQIEFHRYPLFLPSSPFWTRQNNIARTFQFGVFQPKMNKSVP